MSGVVDLGPLIAGGTPTGSIDPALSATLAASHPIVLLPVRVETRFADVEAGGRELRVRIWPDQVHIDAHDPRLTAAEAQAGHQFWLADWRCGADQDRRRRAWSALAERFGPTRAAWIARRTRPENAEARPADAVADTESPRVQPRFGTVALTERPSPPVARLLPAAWTATAYAGGQVVAVATGRPITGDPAVGPDLDAPLVHPDAAGDDADEVAPVDTGMHWLVDFEAAEDLGMALRLPVDGPVDLLLVTGVRSGEPDDGAAGLADLLAAQRFTAGLGILEPGTLTNNTEGAPAGWSSADLGSLGAADAPSAASTQSILRALGLPDADLGDLPGAGVDDALIAAVSRTLWPATWGYWLTQFVGLGAGGLDRADCDWAGEHAAAYVRPGGPWPALRVGRQPYGLLPTTSLTRFQGDARETRLGAILAGLVATGWRPALGEAARVGRGDPGEDLVDVLRLDARSGAVTLRRALGATFAANALDFLARGVPAEAWRVLAARTQQLTQAVGLPATIAGALLLYEPTAWPVDLPLVGEDHPSVLRDLLAADVDALAASTDDRPASLLAALVRQGLLRAHAQAAVRLIDDTSVAPTHDPEFFGFTGSTLGWSAQRDRSVGASTVRARLASDGDPAAADIDAFRSAALRLAAATADELAPHVADNLDAASHRVDAWATSLATRRLAELRAGRPTGVLVGGYGWVEGLAPDPGESVAEPVEGEPAPLRRAADDPGFLHAPSLHQAEVAALLRNAHLGHGGGDDDPFAITITSQRVRLAQRIFAGVRAGRSLGAVLGYLVERDLHERGLDAAVDNAREVAPLPGQELLPIPARRLDGLSLHKLWSDSEDHAVDHLVAGSQDAALRRKAAGVLRRLGVAVDAAADLLQAEQVHHMVRGNLTAAVNTLGDIDRGLAPPPELDVVRTPRTGITVTHRVAVALSVDAAPTGGWAVAGGSPWAASEPALDAWLAQCLGPVAGHQLTLTGGDTEHVVALAALGLTATDFVRMASAGESGVAELTARAARTIPGQLAGTLRAERDLLDLLELGRSLAALVAGARPLDGSKLQPPHADPEPGIDLDELAARAARAQDLVRAAITALAAALAGTGSEGVQASLADAWGFHLGEAAVPAMSDEVSLRAAADRARAALQARLDEAEAIAAATGDDLGTIQQGMRALLGPGFVALPRFQAPDAEDLVSSRDDPALVGEDPLVAETWLMRMERVREPLMRLGVAMREAEALGGAPLRLGVVQTPHHPGAAWNGRPAAAYVDGAASVVLVGADVLAPGHQIAGLLVDELTELVPSATETTGVAFRYEPPTSTAPQALLLAVPPVIGEEWTAGGLNQVLLETLDLAHVRALAPDDLDLVRQFLPATMLAFNTDSDVPSTNPNALQ
ncbi:MAG TPA: hypothetical protein VF143_00430 [Candidatus Nanopelagicales bacterium]